MKTDNTINLEDLEKHINDDENAGNTFRQEEYYGKIVKVTREGKHHGNLTAFIRQYYNLKFIENLKGLAHERKGYSLYELLPK